MKGTSSKKAAAAELLKAVLPTSVKRSRPEVKGFVRFAKQLCLLYEKHRSYFVTLGKHLSSVTLLVGRTLISKLVRCARMLGWISLGAIGTAGLAFTVFGAVLTVALIVSPLPVT